MLQEYCDSAYSWWSASGIYRLEDYATADDVRARLAAISAATKAATAAAAAAAAAAEEAGDDEYTPAPRPAVWRCRALGNRLPGANC